MNTITRLARIAFTFVSMNYAAIAGLVALGRRDDVWAADSREGSRQRS